MIPTYYNGRNKPYTVLEKVYVIKRRLQLPYNDSPMPTSMQTSYSGLSVNA